MSNQTVQIIRHIVCAAFWLVTAPLRVPVFAGVTAVIVLCCVKDWACAGDGDWSWNFRWWRREVFTRILLKGGLLP